MKRITSILAIAVAIVLTACAQTKKETMKQEKTMVSTNRPLVAYFSATGTTAEAAKKLANVTGRNPSARPGIPGGSTLIFEIELLGIA